MAIVYRCRHCGVRVGTIETSFVDMHRLGLSLLSEEERVEMIQYEKDGEITVQTICEDCQEALMRQPDLHQWKTFIQ